MRLLGEISRRLGALRILKEGVLVGARPTVNFKQGTNITLSMADTASSDRIDIEIIAAAGASNPVWNFLEKLLDYTIVAGDITGLGAFIDMDSSGAARTVTLPTIAATSSGQQIMVKRRGANSVTIARASTDTIDGATSYVLTADEEVVALVRPATGARWRTW